MSAHEEFGPVTEALTWEYRDVGEHDMRYGICTVCEYAAGNAFQRSHDRGCPSKRERRRVGPWEPAPSEGEAL